MTTIKEIAAKSGFSPATVSRLLSNDPRLSVTSETKSKIHNNITQKICFLFAQAYKNIIHVTGIKTNNVQKSGWAHTTQTTTQITKT